MTLGRENPGYVAFLKAMNTDGLCPSCTEKARTATESFWCNCGEEEIAKGVFVSCPPVLIPRRPLPVAIIPSKPSWFQWLLDFVRKHLRGGL